uniref:Uncharacterized protein n=1 Tax=Tanacetum cinerariifolium TaxID=118510 RepID=A0A699J5R7_TANCI|nr:hypothetical protein [Tanacetum cinerariifolium]
MTRVGYSLTGAGPRNFRLIHKRCGMRSDICLLGNLGRLKSSQLGWPCPCIRLGRMVACRDNCILIELLI